MDWDYILLAIAGSIIVAGISLGLAVFSNYLKKNTEIKMIKQTLAGKRKNSIKIDGERIEITKHKWKTPEGEIKTLEIKPIKKEEQGNTKKPKKSFLGLFKSSK